MATKPAFTERLTSGFIQGIGWSFGVTFGFTLVSAVVLVFVNLAGGIPVIGGFLANVVDATIAQLELRTPGIYR